MTFRPHVVAPMLSSVQESDKMNQDKGRRQIPKCMHLKKILMVKKTETAPSMVPYHPLDKFKILCLAPRPSTFQPVCHPLHVYVHLSTSPIFSLSQFHHLIIPASFVIFRADITPPTPMPYLPTSLPPSHPCFLLS